MDTKIKKYIIERPDTAWNFEQYLSSEVVIYKMDTVVGKSILLPNHFYGGSNKSNVIKFDNNNYNLCFWCCLAVSLNVNEDSDKKVAYRFFEKPAK